MMPIWPTPDPHDTLKIAILRKGKLSIQTEHLFPIYYINIIYYIIFQTYRFANGKIYKNIYKYIYICVYGVRCSNCIALYRIDIKPVTFTNGIKIYKNIYIYIYVRMMEYTVAYKCDVLCVYIGYIYM